MTTDVQAAQAPEVPAPAPEKGTMQRVVGVLFSPDETFRDIVARPNVLAPLLILVAISIVSAVLLVPKMDFEAMMRDRMANNPKTAQMAPGDVDRAVRMGSSVAKMIGYTSPLLSIGIWALMAAVLLVTLRLFGAEGTFAQAFSVTLYAWVPLIIKNIIGIVVAMTRSAMIDPQQMANLVASNAGVLVDLQEHPVLFALLSSIDLFTIWTVVLLIIGFAYVSRTSKARSAAVVLSWWVVMIFFKVGSAALGAARMKAGS